MSSNLTTLGVVSQVTDVEPRVTAGYPLVFGSMMVCLRQPGSVEVRSIEPLLPMGGVTIRAFGLRPNPLWTGAGPSVIARSGFLKSSGFTRNHQVTLTCDSSTGRSDELGIELSKSTSAMASLRGFLIHYVSEGTAGTLRFPYHIVLCTAPRVENAQCQSA